MNKRSLLPAAGLLLAVWLLVWKRRAFLSPSNRERPVVGDDRYAMIGSYRVHYVEAGHGPPLILIPGSFFDYHEWDLLMPLLVDDFRLIAVDYLGVGDSDKPISGFDYSVQAQAEVVHGLLDALKIPKANVMGVSYGASIALYLGARWPERVNKVISIEGFTNVENVRLPWVDSLASLLSTPVVGNLFIFLIQTGLLDGIRTALAMRQERVPSDPKKVERIERIVRASSRGATVWGWRGIAMSRVTSTIRSHHEPGLLRGGTVPVLQLVGTASVFKKAIQPSLQELGHLPNVSIVTIEGGGHDVQLQKPEVVARIVREFFAKDP